MLEPLLQFVLKNKMVNKENSYKHQFVMLIDDEDLDNFVNEKLIQFSCFSKTTYVNTSAISAFEFLNNLLKIETQAEHIFPKVIFIDINMPIIDGFQLINQLSELITGKNVNPKMVILTSSVSIKDKEKAKALGDYIYFATKPLSPAHLKDLE